MYWMATVLCICGECCLVKSNGLSSNGARAKNEILLPGDEREEKSEEVEREKERESGEGERERKRKRSKRQRQTESQR